MELKEKLAKLKARKRELESLLRNSSQRSSGYSSDWDYGYGSGWDYGYGPYGYDLFGSYDDWDEEEKMPKSRKPWDASGDWSGIDYGSESGEPSEVAGAREDSGAVNGGNFSDLVKGAFGGGKQGASIEATPAPESETQAAKDDWDDLFNRSSRTGKIFDDYSLGTSDIDMSADTGAAPENTANDPDDNWLDKIFGGRGKILGGSVETVDKGTDKQQDPPGVLSSGTEGLLASTNDDYMLGDNPLIAWGKEGRKLIADKPQNMTPEEKESVKQAIATMKYAGYVKEAKQAEELLNKGLIQVQKGLLKQNGALGVSSAYIPRLLGNKQIILEEDGLLDPSIAKSTQSEYYKRLRIASVLVHELFHLNDKKYYLPLNTSDKTEPPAWKQEIEFIKTLYDQIKSKDPNSYKLAETYGYGESREGEAMAYHYLPLLQMFARPVKEVYPNSKY